MSTQPRPVCFTFVFKKIQDLILSVDVYLPSPSSTSACTLTLQKVPAVVFTHGGGLTCGNRQSWFPAWLQRRITSAGCIFLSTEHRLLPPSDGHDIIADVKDLFKFVANDLNPLLRSRQKSGPESFSVYEVDPQAIAVAGVSAGGFCSYLAAMHATPLPCAVLSLYGMGGDYLTPHWFKPKSEVFFRGRELLDPEDFSEFMFPACQHLKVIANSPNFYHPPDSATPGYPSNPRMQLSRLYIQLGVYLDYFTGCHEPSLSAALRNAYAEHNSQSSAQPAMFIPDLLKSLIPKEHVTLFPQFGITPSWPPTFLIHGETDTAVPAHESRWMHALLRDAGVDVTLRIVEGKEHSLDLTPEADGLYGGDGGLFDEAVEFLMKHLK